MECNAKDQREKNLGSRPAFLSFNFGVNERSLKFSFSENATTIWSYLPLDLTFTKGQLISECPFDV